MKNQLIKFLISTRQYGAMDWFAFASTACGVAACAWLMVHIFFGLLNGTIV